MEQTLIGRECERDELVRCYVSKKSEFVITYRRRRVGKTFLVSRVLGEHFFILLHRRCAQAAATRPVRYGAAKLWPDRLV